MKNILLACITCFILTLGVSAQSSDCPASMPANTVCITQDTANKLFDAANQLIAAKDAIAKFTAERAQSDAVIASAKRVIEDFKQLDAINQMQVLKYKDVFALYEKVMAMQQSLIETLEKKLNAPKSGWDKFVGMLKRVGDVLLGVAIGRVL